MSFPLLSRRFDSRNEIRGASAREHRRIKLHVERLEERTLLEGNCPIASCGLSLLSHTDNFDRSDNTVITDDWQEDTGDFAIVSGQVTPTASGISEAYLAPNKFTTFNVRLEATVHVPSTGVSEAGFLARL